MLYRASVPSNLGEGYKVLKRRFSNLTCALNMHQFNNFNLFKRKNVVEDE